MGAIADMTRQNAEFSDGNDSIVIRRQGGMIAGGRTLDMSEFPFDTVRAGHIIIHETETDTYRPLGVANGAYSALPTGHTYSGVLFASIHRRRPFAAIMYDGEVNDIASPYPLTDSIKSALKTAFPSLYFMHD